MVNWKNLASRSKSKTSCLFDVVSRSTKQKHTNAIYWTNCVLVQHRRPVKKCLTKFCDIVQIEATLNFIKKTQIRLSILLSVLTETKGHLILNCTELHINPKYKTMCRLLCDLICCKKKKPLFVCRLAFQHWHASFLLVQFVNIRTKLRSHLKERVRRSASTFSPVIAALGVCKFKFQRMYVVCFPKCYLSCDHIVLVQET